MIWTLVTVTISRNDSYSTQASLFSPLSLSLYIYIYIKSLAIRYYDWGTIIGYFFYIWHLYWCNGLASLTNKLLRVSLILIGCRIHRAFCHIWANHLVCHYFFQHTSYVSSFRVVSNHVYLLTMCLRVFEQYDFISSIFIFHLHS